MVMDVEIIIRVQTREVFETRPTEWGYSGDRAPVRAQHYSYDDALDAGNLMLAQNPNIPGFVIAKSYQRIEEES